MWKRLFGVPQPLHDALKENWLVCQEAQRKTPKPTPLKMVKVVKVAKVETHEATGD